MHIAGRSDEWNEAGSWEGCVFARVSVCVSLCAHVRARASKAQLEPQDT